MVGSQTTDMHAAETLALRITCCRAEEKRATTDGANWALWVNPAGRIEFLDCRQLHSDKAV